ncbi:MAG TPA: right-handed parallel beta-helix repeat-containing protein [Chitinispirillaceae bacterium]|jgi:hypothetical protein|nr:right-handed parallel beta-helix repeat-containing protein [Chitinispirillaceae bacterium]
MIIFRSNKALRVCLAMAAGLVFPVLSFAASIQVPSMGIQTISEAMMRTRVGDTVWVDKGVYREHVLIAPGVTLISRSQFAAVIDGAGRGTVVTMGKNTSISGFEIRNGTIGIFSNGAGNSIVSCRIVKNWQTGIIVVRHLPKIEDNIIAFNRGSGIQGWDVRSTNATINHNSIAYNGNHGVAIGGASEIIMENNVVAHNERFGLKILSEAEKIQVSNNNFYRNLPSPRPIPSGNFSFDPAFISPRATLTLKSDPAQCCKAKGTDNEELGARLTY